VFDNFVNNEWAAKAD